MSAQAKVILVHGLWFGSWAMARLAKRLEAEGFVVRRFDYSTTSGGIETHALRLQGFARETGGDRRHFVSHSLGGLVTLKMLSGCGELPPGRVVLLGSPLDGSTVARKTQKLPGAKRLLGEARTILHKGYQSLPTGRETGMIAGSRAVGLGMLVGGPGKPGDGTVSVRETRTDGLTDHLVLPVTHTGMLYSAEVARQAAWFLKNGGFDRRSA